MNTWISWKTSQTGFLILLGLLFLSHLLFIEADPDRNMSVGRGPFTDEGLNTIQVRNWVNHGELNLAECDNLLKTPMLGFPLAVTYTIFGASHVVSRLHVLILVFLALLWIGLDRKRSPMMIIFLSVTMMLYQVFQSSHFSMGEMLSVGAVLLSIHFLARSSDMQLSKRSRNKQALLAGIFLSLSYFIKIQFIYLIILLPLVLIFYWLTSDSFVRKMIPRQGIIISATLLIFLFLYLFAWYLPNREAYDFIMAHQSGEFVLSDKIWGYIHFNLGYHFFKGWMLWFCILFAVLFVSGIIILKKKQSGHYKILFISSLVWFFLELHKMAMVYLPTRYQVSLLVSMGLLMSIVLNELLVISAIRWKLPFKLAVISVIFFLVAINLYNYTDSLQHRKFAIKEANKYLARHTSEGQVVLGAWAPSLTWESKSKAIPVWNNFLNYKDPVVAYHPEVIIAETDEQDSEQAWSGQGIMLKELADSSRTVEIGQWKINIYWMKKSDQQ
jgi:hypothetical protein